MKSQENEKSEDSESKDHKRLSTIFFKLPILANKFMQNTTVGKKISKSRAKNLSESTASSLLKQEEDNEDHIIDYSALRKKVNLNAVIEERGQMKNVSDNEDEKGTDTVGNENLFVDKRREYFMKYSKMMKVLYSW